MRSKYIVLYFVILTALVVFLYCLMRFSGANVLKKTAMYRYDPPISVMVPGIDGAQ